MNDDREPVGSVAEEAAKLLGALQGWAKEGGGDFAEAAAGAAAGAAASWDGLNEHIATGGEDCRYCPLCQVISAVRETSPEVKHHLASAATSLMQAAAGALATHQGAQQKPGRESPVEKIDLSEDEDWEED